MEKYKDVYYSIVCCNTKDLLVCDKLSKLLHVIYSVILYEKQWGSFMFTHIYAIKYFQVPLLIRKVS